MQFVIDFVTIGAAILGSLAVFTSLFVAGVRVWGSLFPLPPAGASQNTSA